MHCQPKVGNDFPMSTSTNVGQIADISMAGFCLLHWVWIPAVRHGKKPRLITRKPEISKSVSMSLMLKQARFGTFSCVRMEVRSDAPSERCFRQPRKEREMQILFSRFMNDESGATAIEYG